MLQERQVLTGEPWGEMCRTGPGSVAVHGLGNFPLHSGCMHFKVPGGAALPLIFSGRLLYPLQPALWALFAAVGGAP